MLSVLISVYGGERADYLERSLRSVWTEQSRQPDEIVLVKDGGLSVELEHVLRHWQRKLGSRLRIVSLPKNVGLGAALRAGLSLCQGEVVARMDSDDIALPERFERQLGFLAKFPNVDVLGSAAILINESSSHIGIRRMPSSHDSIMRNIWSCPIIHPSAIFRRDAVLRAGSYNDRLPRRQEDFELWIRCARASLRFHNMEEPLIIYQIYNSREQKNSIGVGWHRLLIGWSAVAEFDPRIISFLGLAYPLLRALTPKMLKAQLMRFAKRWDPRGLP
jgi:glycosyltransferase involved in cell wall biosynthesis